MKPNIEINIEELVLHGFNPGDKYEIGRTMEIELARLFADQGVPGVLSENINIDRFNAGTFSASPNAKPVSIGIQTAKSVYNSFMW
jgi:hypothetical protein